MSTAPVLHFSCPLCQSHEYCSCAALLLFLHRQEKCSTYVYEMWRRADTTSKASVAVREAATSTTTTTTSRVVNGSNSAKGIFGALETRFEDAMIIGDRVRTFNDIMALRNFAIGLLPLIMVGFAVRRWANYALSAKYIIGNGDRFQTSVACRICGVHVTVVVINHHVGSAECHVGSAECRVGLPQSPSGLPQS